MLDPTVISPARNDRQPRPLLRTTLGDVLRRTRREQGRTLADVVAGGLEHRRGDIDLADLGDVTDRARPFAEHRGDHVLGHSVL